MRKFINKQGYVILIAPHYPRAFNEKISEHSFIMEEYLGRSLPKGSVVHHRNRVRSDNRLENLLLLESTAAHVAIHRAIDNNDARTLHKLEEKSKEFMAKLKIDLPEANKSIPSYSEDKKNENSRSLEPNKLIVRRNKKTNQIFIEYDEDILISPDGKDIEFDLERFSGPEEVPESELSIKQLNIYHNRMKAHDLKTIHDQQKIKTQKQLFNELRKERNKIANAKNVPVYKIFDNQTLIEMSEVMPDSESALRQIYGVGPAKLKMYGRLFLLVIKKFRDETDVA